MKERKAEKRFTDLNTAMQQYFIVTGMWLEPLPPKPVLCNFYVPQSRTSIHNIINDQNRSFSVVFR